MEQVSAHALDTVLLIVNDDIADHSAEDPRFACGSVKVRVGLEMQEGARRGYLCLCPAEADG